jgi:hypothetical protein
LYKKRGLSIEKAGLLKLTGDICIKKGTVPRKSGTFEINWGHLYNKRGTVPRKSGTFEINWGQLYKKGGLSLEKAGLLKLTGDICIKKGDCPRKHGTNGNPSRMGI